nr:DUF4176 domain-containing protein [Streptococcus equi]
MSTVTMLPLGSIVILKGNTKKMMIIARVIAAPIKGRFTALTMVPACIRRA